MHLFREEAVISWVTAEKKKKKRRKDRRPPRVHVEDCAGRLRHNPAGFCSGRTLLVS